MYDSSTTAPGITVVDTFPPLALGPFWRSFPPPKLHLCELLCCDVSSGVGEEEGEEAGEEEPSHLEESFMGDLRDQKWSPSENEERSIWDCSVSPVRVSGELRRGEREGRLTGHAGCGKGQEMAGDEEEAKQMSVKSHRRAHAEGSAWEDEETRSLLFPGKQW